MFQCQDELECCNYRLEQWLLQLENISDDYYQCIGELWNKVCRLNDEAEFGTNEYVSCTCNNDNSLDVLKKGFSLDKSRKDRRKKLCDLVEIISNSLVKS